jgi:ribosomal-protein-alanine N-acetyltransferase
MKKIKKLETERLFLYPVSLDDSQFVLDVHNSPKFIQFIGDRNLRTIEDAENYIKKRFLPHYEKFGFGNCLIVRKSDGKKIGAVGVFVRDGLDVPDIGFSFLPEFEGKGYGFEASSKLMETVFTDFGLKKISAITTEKNIFSKKLIEKLGLKYLKMIRLPDDEEKLKYYEIEK